VVIGAIQIVVVLMLGEVAVRLAAPHHRGLRMLLGASTRVSDFSDADTLPEIMNRTMLGFSPGSVEYGFVLNSRSFRTREYQPGPARGGLRVVALGDSFTFASGALPHEDHWTTLVEEELDRRSDRPVEVLRLGVPDTGPAFQLRLWQIEAAGLEPNIVVMAFFIGNDFIDDQGDCGVFGGGDRGFSGRLASVSTLYRAARNLRRVLSAGGEPVTERGSDGEDGTKPVMGQPIPAYREAFDPGRPTFGREQFIAIENQRMALCLRSEEAAFRPLAERAAEIVKALSAEVGESGSRFVVMLIPDQFQVDQALVDEVLRTTGRRREDYDFERPQRVLGRSLRSAGIEVLDLLPVFRAAPGGEALYRPRDTHWNRRGNELAAAELTAILWSGPMSGRRAVFADDFERGSADGWSAVENSEKSTHERVPRHPPATGESSNSR
jgi:hypothetical protein